MREQTEFQAGTYLAISALRSAKISRSGRASVAGLASSSERHFMRGAHGHSDRSGALSLLLGQKLSGRAFRGVSLNKGMALTTFSPLVYTPGSFIPASLRAKLGLPICLNIFFIWAYWRSRLFTSWIVVPDPRAMRLRRLPLMTS